MTNIRQDIKTRDAIDFASAPVGRLFRQMFFPTLLGMISMVLLNLADGAFIGHGVGSIGIAAVNIAAPIFNIMAGIGIMFGSGASIIASIHLSRGNTKAARINVTQAFIGSIIASSIVAFLILANLDATCRLFGSSDKLVPHAGRYLKWIAASLPLQMLGMVGGFAVRLDGSPKYSMCCTLCAALLNIVLDYIFIFPLDMGLEGAAKATVLSFTTSGLIVILYIFRFSRTIRPYALRISAKSIILSIRNMSYQIRAGFSAMIGELAISGAIVIGNFIFIRYLGEDGVAAYGIACYCMPVIFMVGNAIVQSVQPVISFAYGVSDGARVLEARNVAIKGALIAGITSTIILSIGREFITQIFLAPGQGAYDLCMEGLPYFSLGGVLISVNILMIGYYQSTERMTRASALMLLRGFILLIPVFILLPKVLGTAGIWLAIPVTEALTLIFMIAVSGRPFRWKRREKNG